MLVFHGCPDTRRVAMTGDAAAHEVGVRLLAFNRPGYGSSTPTDSTHTTVARDAAELLDLWGIERVAVLGMSVGGPYAAAFAATYPDRTTSLALVSAPSMPDDAPEGTVEESMERMAPEFLAWRARIDPDDEDDEALAARFLAELPEADAALLAPYGSGPRRGPGLGGAGRARGLPARRRPADAALGLRRRRRPLPGHRLGRRGRRQGDGRLVLVDGPVAAGGARGGAGHHPPGDPAHPVAGDPATPANRDGLISEGGLRTWAASSYAAPRLSNSPSLREGPTNVRPTGRRPSRR